MKIVCVGNSAYDITFSLDNYPIENFKYKVQNRKECGGGSCGNAAYLLAKWGIETYFIGLVGNDEYGIKIKDEFINVGVKTNYLQLADNYQTATSHIIVNKQNGSRTILSYHPNEREMDDIELDFKPDIILMDGREYRMSKKFLKKYPNAVSIIDASSVNEHVKELCCLCDYVVCSKDFMEKISNEIIKDVSDLAIAFSKLEDIFNTNIIVTLESEGCAYKKDNEVIVIPTIKVEAIDTTGAGDIFHGAFVYGISNNWPLEKILKFSNIAGAMSVTKVGGRDSVFSLNEVEEVYNEIR